MDIRLGSPHFGKWTSVLLSAEEQNQIYIPAGFAHGFLALTDTVQFLYKCSDFYDPADEHGMVWNDPALHISWGVANPLVSEKDAKYPKLPEIPHEFLPRYSRNETQNSAHRARMVRSALNSRYCCLALGEVIALDRQQLDLAKPEEFAARSMKSAPHLIVNAAAYTAVDQAETEEALARAINAEAPAVMAQEAKKIGAGLSPLLDRLRVRWLEDSSLRRERSSRIPSVFTGKRNWQASRQFGRPACHT